MDGCWISSFALHLLNHHGCIVFSAIAARDKEVTTGESVSPTALRKCSTFSCSSRWTTSQSSLHSHCLCVFSHCYYSIYTQQQVSLTIIELEWVSTLYKQLLWLLCLGSTVSSSTAVTASNPVGINSTITSTNIATSNDTVTSSSTSISNDTVISTNTATSNDTVTSSSTVTSADTAISSNGQSRVNCVVFLSIFACILAAFLWPLPTSTRM